MACKLIISVKENSRTVFNWCFKLLFCNCYLLNIFFKKIFALNGKKLIRVSIGRKRFKESGSILESNSVEECNICKNFSILLAQISETLGKRTSRSVSSKKYKESLRRAIHLPYHIDSTCTHLGVTAHNGDTSCEGAINTKDDTRCALGYHCQKAFGIGVITSVERQKGVSPKANIPTHSESEMLHFCIQTSHEDRSK